MTPAIFYFEFKLIKTQTKRTGYMLDSAGIPYNISHQI